MQTYEQQQSAFHSITAMDLESGRDTNNQHASIVYSSHSINIYPRDPKYYFPDGSGVFLIDGTLFKVYAMQLFGSCPGISPNSTSHKDPGVTYVEEILPRLSSSSDDNPIQFPGIRGTQFRSYLLVLTGRPYDEEYLTLLTGYLQPDKHDRALCVRYLDIATLAHQFGMRKLEEWAIDALHAIFTRPTEFLAKVAMEQWDSDTLLRMRAFTKSTKLGPSVSAFIQCFISINLNISGDATGGSPTNTTNCLDLHNSLATSNDDPPLLGCTFLSILSLGHRSPVWVSNLTRHERAIMYTAQAQLVDLSDEFQSLGLLQPPGSVKKAQLCSDCLPLLERVWEATFERCTNELGSGFPLNDVRSLAQLPGYRWKLFRSISDERPGLTPIGCGKWFSIVASKASVSSHPRKCTGAPTLDYVDDCIRQIHEEAAARYMEFAQ